MAQGMGVPGAQKAEAGRVGQQESSWEEGLQVGAWMAFPACTFLNFVEGAFKADLKNVLVEFISFSFYSSRFLCHGFTKAFSHVLNTLKNSSHMVSSSTSTISLFTFKSLIFFYE